MEKTIIESPFGYYQSLAIAFFLLIALWGLVKLDRRREEKERERIMEEVEKTIKID